MGRLLSLSLSLRSLTGTGSKSRMVSLWPRPHQNKFNSKIKCTPLENASKTTVTKIRQ